MNDVAIRLDSCTGGISLEIKGVSHAYISQIIDALLFPVLCCAVQSQALDCVKKDDRPIFSRISIFVHFLSSMT